MDLTKRLSSNITGKVYVIEGPDGAGKTSAINELKKLYDESESPHKVVFLRDQTTHSEATCKIRDIIHDHYSELDIKTILLLQLASRVELDNEIEDALSKGYDVILDRYFTSTFVYQGKELDHKYIEEVMASIDGLHRCMRHAGCAKIFIFRNDHPFKSEKDDSIEETNTYEDTMKRYIDYIDGFLNIPSVYKKYKYIDTYGKSPSDIAKQLYKLINS